ncbi:armadillo repeat-containing protein 8-like isoform X2 [Phymastichus coffea]|uniref:armadillo repeat-containing protein 8-like isoform X2 n=1 Tax=Phymastichus coffea TaxID=108790 RepID=UPI00273B9E57|nr:armadillo repeat-containing protein 8-like isoform X2 [Phymastichus coffea]XP_058803535.1 armadillo repeat-containing protein 8-like isoform X2 [Phymastichus coffea]
MVSVMQAFMDIESSRSYIDELYATDHQKCLDAIICLKNSVIGSNRQKGSVIAQGVVPRLLQLLCDSDHVTNDNIRLEAAVTLGSLAKGTDQHVLALIDLGVVNSLLQVMSKSIESSSNIEDIKLHHLLVEACLRCLRTIFQHSSAPVSLIFQDQELIPCLLQLSNISINCQVYVAMILTTACKINEEQNILLKSGAINTLAKQLESTLADVQLPALACLANMCYQNQEVASLIISTKTSDNQKGKYIPDVLSRLTGRDKNSLIQLEAARCISYMYRAQALPATDSRVVYKALPCLIRLCHKERPARERVAAAETLAYLTEVDTDLQRLASISNHLIPTLAEFLKPNSQTLDAALLQDMRQAAFRAFASLGANDEDIRKRIIETENLMEQVVAGLQDPGGSKVRLAAVRCLHSLSRSVQQLRTTFQDHAVWRPLMQLLHGADKGSDGKNEGEDDLLTVASGTLCNLLLEFSPSKEPILESGGVELLCSLTKRSDPALRLNGIWALMNVAFQAEQRVKSQILTCLGTDQIFRLLADPELSVLMKTLGLLRNLLSTKTHIDRIMADHAAHVMQAVILVLEDPVHPADVKEQALCILANVADGDRARDHIMANEDVLKKLMDYMMHSNVKLQVAAIFCVCNLVWREEPGAAQRQSRLKELGLYRILLQLRHTKDTQLFDKVKTALAQFFDA